MIILDAHQDIAYNAINFDRDYTRNALETRRIESQRGNDYPLCTLGLPDALLGRVGIVFATVFAPHASAARFMPAGKPTYSTPAEAYKLGMEQLDYYKRLADNTAKIRLIHNPSDLDAVLKTWDAGTELDDHQQGFVLLMEGAEPILEPKQLEEWYARGVRIVGPAWTETRYAGGTGAPGPLSKLGRELLDNMAGLGAILDLSHLAEQAFYDALDIYTGPIIASHSNPRKFKEGDRHLSDAMIRMLAERDGVMGVVFYNRFLKNTWSQGDPRPPFSIIVDVIDYVCQLTGSSAHIGIGTDFDGGFGARETPQGIETVTDLWNIRQALLDRGYSENHIADILSGNMLRKLREGLR